MILNKIEKNFQQDLHMSKEVFSEFQICFTQNPICKGMESTI